MRKNDCDRTVAHSAAGCVWFLAIFLGTAAGLSAQPMSPYGNGTTPPVQQTQNIYYGNYQNNTVPGYIYPRTYPMPANTGYSGNGITYYYVNNPNGPNSYPFTSPYGTPPAYQANNRTPTYPMPINTPPARPPYTPIDDDLGDGRKPVVSFHRQTNEQGWVTADYLASFLRPMRLGSGPLVTTGSPAAVSPGALGSPATRVLSGGDVDFGLSSGVRLQAGMFLDNDNRFSLDLGGFVLLPNRQTTNFMGDPTGNPVLSRPIFDVVRGAERVFLNSDPGNITGTLSTESKAEMFGVELNARYHSYIRERLHADFLVGFRYLRLSERLLIQEQLSNVSPNFMSFLGNPVTGTDMLADQDFFGTVNQFFGPQIGAHVSYEYKCFTLDAFAKLAIGPSLQQTNINGSTTLISVNGNQVANGGILALPSNSGTHNRAIFGIVPETGLNVGVDLTQHLRLNLGYSFLAWNHVVRPGSQYDRAVNPTQIPGSPTFINQSGATSPSYRFNDEFFWSHTLNIGLEIHF